MFLYSTSVLQKSFLHVAKDTAMVGFKIMSSQPSDDKSKSLYLFLFPKLQIPEKILIGLGLGPATSLEPITVARGKWSSEKPGLGHLPSFVVSNSIRITWLEQQGSSCPEEGGDAGQMRQ